MRNLIIFLAINCAMCSSTALAGEGRLSLYTQVPYSLEVEGENGRPVADIALSYSYERGQWNPMTTKIYIKTNDSTSSLRFSLLENPSFERKFGDSRDDRFWLTVKINDKIVSESADAHPILSVNEFLLDGKSKPVAVSVRPWSDYEPPPVAGHYETTIRLVITHVASAFWTYKL